MCVSEKYTLEINDLSFSLFLSIYLSLFPFSLSIIFFFSTSHPFFIPSPSPSPLFAVLALSSCVGVYSLSSIKGWKQRPVQIPGSLFSITNKHTHIVSHLTSSTPAHALCNTPHHTLSPSNVDWWNSKTNMRVHASTGVCGGLILLVTSAAGEVYLNWCS